jgi:catechol 2,3-dioxygenase-like lactoylglutathione lyase family enzyme
MSEQDLRPPVWVGHVVLETARLEETAQFMRKVGLRPIVRRPNVAVLELRGGTHLVLVSKPEVVAGEASFDLMVEDLRATHQRFIGLGLAPTPIEAVSDNHERFLVREPAGNVISFFSNHVSGQPV